MDDEDDRPMTPSEQAAWDRLTDENKRFRDRTRVAEVESLLASGRIVDLERRIRVLLLVEFLLSMAIVIMLVKG